MNKKDDFLYALAEYIILWVIGGFTYVLIELGYRGRSHWTMAIVGGLCFIVIGAFNEGKIPNLLGVDSFEGMCACGSLATTIVEFISGLIINKLLGWNVWDYSNTPFNILGQICLPFTLIWLFIAALAIIVDDFLRHVLFEEPFKEYYFIFLGKRMNFFAAWERYVCKDRHTHDRGG